MVGATFNYSATIWSLARGLIGLLLAISSGVGTMGNEVGDVGPWERFMIQVERWGGRLCHRGDEIGVTEKEIEAGKWTVVMEKHQENISTSERKNSWSVFYWQRGKKGGVNLRKSLYLADWQFNVVEHIACSVEEPPVSRTTMRVLEAGKGFFL